MRDTRQSQRLVRPRQTAQGRLPPPAPPSLLDVYEQLRGQGLTAVFAEFAKRQQEHNRQFALWFAQQQAGAGDTGTTVVPGVGEKGEKGDPGPEGPAGPMGLRGPPGEPGVSAGNYHHQQDSASATWTINHNLGFKPRIILFDQTGRHIYGELSYPTENRVVVTYGTPVAGSADLA